MSAFRILNQSVVAVAATLFLTLSFTSQAQSLYDRLPVTDLDGQAVDLNQYKGKLVLLNFWATWCPPCIKEMPSMQRLQDQFSEQDFQVLAVNMGQNATTVESFLMEREFDFSLPVYLDEKGKGFTDLKLQGMPSSFLINAEGEVLETIVGGREWDTPDTVAALKEMVNKE